MKTTQLPISQEQLVQAWQQAIPSTFHPTDRVEVTADTRNPQSLLIHVHTAGHSNYSFDYECRYVDQREVQVRLIEMQENGYAISRPSADIEDLSESYMRHIHECAQTLHPTTHPH